MKIKKGFSLVEVLISLFLLALALGAISSTFASSTKLLIHTFDHEKATMLAAEQLDTLEAGDFDTLASSSDVEGSYQLQWIVSGDTESKTITLSVSWDGLNKQPVTMVREISPFAHTVVSD